MELIDMAQNRPLSRASSAMSKVEHYMRAESRLSELPKPDRLETESKSQYAWRVVRHCVRGAIGVTMKEDVKEKQIYHGIQSSRKILHANPIHQMLYNKITKEFLTVDGEMLRIFHPDGSKKEVLEPEEPFNRLLHTTQLNLFIGWTYGASHIVLMTKNFEVLSSCNALGPIHSFVYNENIGEAVVTGRGFITSWVFRYGGRHLLPRKITQDGLEPEDTLDHLVLEQTASRAQRGFTCNGKGIYVFNLHDGRVSEYKTDLHVRTITAILYFNPLKYMVTASKEGSIKVWDEKWHLQLVFVGHCGAVTSLAVYPYGPNIMSASQDSTIRVWSLETCDEVDMIKTEETPTQLGTMVNSDTFFSITQRNAQIWKVQHIHRLHTRVNQKISLIKVTDHPEYPPRAVLLCHDSSVRITSPATGNVLTTLLMPHSRGLVDAAYAVADDMLFAVFADGDIIKAYTGTNPCTQMEQWKCQDFSEACNYLLVYEYVITADVATETLGGIKHTAATTNKAQGAPSRCITLTSAPSTAKNTANRTLLLGGRKDGHICVFNMDTGRVEFMIEAHDSRGVLSMIANSKNDQIISAGLDNIIKVWRLYPYAQESLAPLMSFYCAHLPLHMSVLRSRLAVAFQESTIATYSIVMYNLQQGKNRLDHAPEDDHSDSIVAVSACSKMKLLASCSMDGTIRIWNEHNNLVRVINLNASPSSMSFCSMKGDLLVAIGDHLHRIDYKIYMPKRYRFKMAAMSFPEVDELHEALPLDATLLQKLSKEQQRRLKNARSSFKFTHFMDVITAEESEEVTREKRLRQEGYQKIAAREKELEMMKDGEVKAKKRRKATKTTRSEAFDKYLDFFYTRNKFELPQEDMSIKDKVYEMMQEKPIEVKDTSWHPEKEPAGFFNRPGSAVLAPHPPPPRDAPIQRDAMVPNSVLARLLWPKPEMTKAEEEAYRPPVLDEKQLAEISEHSKPDDQMLLKPLNMKKCSKCNDRPLIIHWSDSEDEDQVKDDDELIECSGAPAALSTMLAKMDLGTDQMDASMSRRQQEELDKLQREALQRDTSLLGDDVKPPQQQPSRRNIQKMVAPPPPSPPPSPSPSDLRSTKPLHDASASTKSRFVMRVEREPSPEPVSEHPDMLPRYIQAFKDEPWFTKYYPNLNEHNMSKPWTVNSCITMLLRILKVTDYDNKYLVLDALTEINDIEGIPDTCTDLVSKTLLGVFGHHTKPPTVQDADQRKYIDKGLDLLHAVNQNDIDFYTELMVQYMQADMPIREKIKKIMIDVGLMDTHCYLTKELDSWDVWNLAEENASQELRKMCKAWLDKWMCNFKLHLSDTILKLKQSGSITGRNVSITSSITGRNVSNTSTITGRNVSNTSSISNTSNKSAKRAPSKLLSGSGSRVVSSAKAHKSEAMLKTSWGFAISVNSSLQSRQSLPQIRSRKKIPLQQSTSAPFSENFGRSLTGAKLPCIRSNTECIGGFRTLTLEHASKNVTEDDATYMDAMNYFCEMDHGKVIDRLRMGHTDHSKNTVLVLPKLHAQKGILVRLGETHTSVCKPERETQYAVDGDLRLPAVTTRGKLPPPGELYSFPHCINLPLNSININPFLSAKELREMEKQAAPILLMLTTAQKYFVQERSVVPPQDTH